MGVKLVVVACNTAAAVALELAHFEVDVPIVGVIEPGARPGAGHHERPRWRHRHGGHDRLGGLSARRGRTARAGHADRGGLSGFVEFVERGETGTDQVHVLAERLLSPVRAAEVDALLLGCTHYPFMARTISDVMGRDVVLVSSADETAFEVRALMHDTGLVRRTAGKGRHRFFSSGDVAWFRELGAQLLGPELDEVEAWPWA